MLSTQDARQTSPSLSVSSGRIVAGLKSVDYETRLAVFNLFPLGYCRLGGDLILIYTLYEQSLANGFFTVDPGITRRGHSPGQLTEKGIVQEFQLGQWIRQRYNEYIPSMYNGSELHMRSTDVDRTLMSAQAVAAGIYQNASSPLQDYGIPWRPIPVHTVRQEADVLLSIAKCPCLDVLRKIQMNSDAAISFEQSHRSLFELINKNMETAKIDRFNLMSLVDLFICMRAHNMSLPGWCTEEVFHEMVEVGKFFWAYASTPDILRLEIGVFLDVFVHHLKSITNATNSSTVQGHQLSVQHTMAYSAHDTDVTYLLGAFGAFNNETIPYSAAIVFELIGPDPPSPIPTYQLRLNYKRGYLDTVGEYRTMAPCTGQPGESGCPLDLVLSYLESYSLDPDEFSQLAKVNSMRIIRLEIGVFLHTLVEHITYVTQGTLATQANNQTKHLAVQHTMAYSGHDSDLVPFLAAMGVYDGGLVAYSSCAVVELLGPPPPAPIEAYYLRLLYKRGWEDRDGEYLQFGRVEKCKGRPGIDGCRLDWVLESIKPLLLDPNLYESECVMMDYGAVDRLMGLFRRMSASTMVLFTFAILLIASFSVIILGLLAWRTYRSRNMQSDMISFARLQPTA
ncbi:hypothetical protein T265_00653 [Opisthorchis viverrini]|uniref:acid phosphatase n=1 Tax=Opisthorchis viverrini TaxID=6198 RepID=A0A075A5G5_OPIVI|nr:hypothetical protein T265_00653 [Opisthorchis viverrini]KER33542.1 hypothetical protein T265_00653 [Opisthorchis viverrini]